MIKIIQNLYIIINLIFMIKEKQQEHWTTAIFTRYTKREVKQILIITVELPFKILPIKIILIRIDHSVGKGTR